MRATAALKCSAAALGVGGLALLALGAAPHTAEGQANALPNRRLAFVVADINYANSDRPREAAGLPEWAVDGLSRNLRAVSRGAAPRRRVRR